MRRLLFILVLFIVSIIETKAQFHYDWSIGVSMGLGHAEKKDGSTMAFGLTMDFNKVIQDTKWRWGVEAGIFSLGTGWHEEKEEDDYIRTVFRYIGGIMDYSLCADGEIDIFTRVGIAPSCQIDYYVYHEERSFALLGLFGVGIDIGFNRLMCTYYLSNQGIPTFLFTYGWHFGKRSNR